MVFILKKIADVMKQAEDSACILIYFCRKISFFVCFFYMQNHSNLQRICKKRIPEWYSRETYILQKAFKNRKKHKCIKFELVTLWVASINLTRYRIKIYTNSLFRRRTLFQTLQDKQLEHQCTIDKLMHNLIKVFM